jgi:hypothetical protein
MKLEKLYKNPMCSGMMHKIPWGQLTDKDKDVVTDLLCSIGAPSTVNEDWNTHKKILKILKKYEGKEV